MDTLAGMAVIIAKLFMYVAAWFWKGMFLAVEKNPVLLMTVSVIVYISIFVIDRIKHPEERHQKPGHKHNRPEDNNTKDTTNDRILSEYTLD